MKNSEEPVAKPVIDFEIVELKITIAIPNYEQPIIDPTMYITIDPECHLLGLDDKPITLNY
jgi:hypothetical protein